MENYADHELFAGASEVGRLEEARQDDTSQMFGAGVPMLPSLDNVAEDPNIIEWLNKNLYQLVSKLRSRRQPLELEWQALRRMGQLVRDDGAKYLGRSQAYVPVWARTANTLISTIQQGLFPSDDYMDVYDRGSGDTETARALKAYMQFEFETVGQVRRYTKPGIRQFVTYGNFVAKFVYKKELKVRGRMLKGLDAMLTAGFSQESSAYDEGLCFSARDLFKVWAYPETAESQRDLLLVMEDIDMPRAHIERMGRLRRWVNVDAALTGSQPTETAYNRSQQMADQGAMPDVNEFVGNELAEVRTLTEVWTFAPLPKKCLLQGEQEGDYVPTRILLAGAANIPLVVMRNPYFHQCFPYLIGRQNVEPGFFWGSGSGRLARWLQYLANDFANQTNDAGIYALNPILVLNPSYVAGPLPPLRPGVTWKMTNINEGMRFERPPIELMQAGNTQMNQYISMTQDFSGAPNVLQGSGAGKAAKTATGAQILQRNALSPLQDLVEDLENDVLVPLMRGAWRNAMQYRETDTVLRVMGSPLTVRPEDLAIDAEFRWLASSQAANAQQRAQAGIQFIQSLLPLMPLLNQQGYVVDPLPLLRRVYNDGLGFRGFDEMIKQAQAGAAPGSAPPMQPGQPPQQTPATQEQGDRVRSALEQLNGQHNSGDMVPGEGGDFMQMRHGADETAALQGGRRG